MKEMASKEAGLVCNLYVGWWHSEVRVYIYVRLLEPWEGVSGEDGRYGSRGIPFPSRDTWILPLP